MVFNVDNIGTGEDWAIGLRRNYFDPTYVQTHDTRPQMDFMVCYESSLGLLQYWEYSYRPRSASQKCEFLRTHIFWRQTVAP